MVAIIVPIVWYLMARIKPEIVEDKNKNYSEGEYVEIGGFRFTENSKQIPEENVLIRHEVHGWPIYQSGTLVKSNGEVWTLAVEGHQGESGRWTKIKKLGKAKLDKLKELIRNSDFFKLPIKISESFKDGSAEVWFANLDGEEHKILMRVFNEEKKPEVLKKLDETLQAL